ncbi:MAG: RHS repeat-associated core domain-containing protein, partial [Ilumatobacteraceae bacterium]
ATYSALSEQLTATDPSGARTTWGYDTGGRVASVTDPLSRRTATEYDLAGRAVATRSYGPTGTLLSTVRATFDAAGNRIGVVSPRGNVTGAAAAAFTTTFGYDVLSRLVRVTEPTSATVSMVTSYGYDVAGNQTQLTDGRGNVTSYSFNVWGLQSGVVEPSTTAFPSLLDRSWSTTFDAGGLPVREVQPGGVVVTRSFDELGRLTSETGSGTGVVTASRSFTYDAGGVRTSVSSPAGVIGFVVDDRRLLTATTGPAAVVSSFSYDASGRMVSRTDGSGSSSFGWDSRGLLRSVTDPLTATVQTRGYDAAGQLVSVAYAGGGSRALGYDGLGRRTSDVLKTSAGVVSSSVAVGFDADSNVTSRVVVLPGNSGAGSNSYGYDNVGRLVSWTAPSGAVKVYGWDAAGNLTGNAGVSQVFDARNRLVSSGSVSYGWSARGTLTSTKAGTAAVVVSVFDGLGRQTTSGSQVLVYDGLDRVVSNGSTGFGFAGVGLDPVTVGNVKLARGPAGGLVAGKVGTTQAVLVGSDGHGDVTHLFTAAGVVSGSRLYDPFGGPTGSGGTFGVPVGFQGDYTSPVSGDVWMGARWYRPGTGSFTSRDSVQGQLVTPVSANRYTYAWADPLGMWDPDGRAPAGSACSADVGSMSAEDFAGWVDSFASGGGQSGCVAGRAKTVVKDVAVFAGGVAVTAVAAAGCAAVAGPNPFASGAAAQVCGGAASRAYGTLVAGGTVKQALVNAGNWKRGLRDGFVGSVTGGLGSMSALSSLSVSAKVLGQGSLAAVGGAAYDASDVLLSGGSWSSALSAAWNPTRRITEAASGSAAGYLGARKSSNEPSPRSEPTPSPNPGATEAVPGGSNRAIVIGEDMEGRVIPKARELGADYYDPPVAPRNQWMENNRQWINDRMDGGCTLYNCGPAPGRANYPNPTSPYYQMELDEIAKRNYPIIEVR